jgi:hypothetical protein
MAALTFLARRSSFSGAEFAEAVCSQIIKMVSRQETTIEEIFVVMFSPAQ